MSALGVSVVLLWIAVVVLAALVFALARQIGVLHERIGPVGALTLARGVKPGESLPSLALETLAGAPWTTTASAESGRGLLLFFLSPTCPICKSLLPVVRRIADAEREWLDVVLASDGGDAAAHRKFVGDLELDGFRYVLSEPLGLAIGVSKLPYAALVDESGIVTAHGLVNSREHLESLFEARALGVASMEAYAADERGRKV